MARMENQESLREILRNILREDKSLLARREELIARLEKNAGIRMMKELSPLKTALRKNIGEYFLAVDHNASDKERASVIENAERLLIEGGMQERPTKNVIETLRYALRWDERGNVAESQESAWDFSDEDDDGEGAPEQGQMSSDTDAEGEWHCLCGEVNHGKFCVACGRPKQDETTWECAACGQKNHGAFCTGCGASKNETFGIVAPESAQGTGTTAEKAEEIPAMPEASPQVSLAPASSSVAGTHGNSKKIMFGSIAAVLLIAFLFAFSGKQDTRTAGSTPQAAQRASEGMEEASQGKQNGVPTQPQKPKPEKKTPDMPSDLGLGGICIGYQTNKVHEILGKESEITDPDHSGHKRYQYNDLEVVITNGVVTGFVSKNGAVATKRGIRQGSSLQEVLSAYGNDYSSFSYDGMTLYEYALVSMDNKKCLLRFAVKNGYVDYVSARTLEEDTPKTDTKKNSASSVTVEIDSRFHPYKAAVFAAGERFVAYHDAISAREYNAAYDCYTAQGKRNRGARENFGNGYQDTLSSKVTGLSAAYADNGKVILYYNLTARDRTSGAKVKVQKFSGTVTMLKENREWKIDSMESKKLNEAYE